MNWPFTVYDFFATLSSGFLLLIAGSYAFDAARLLTKKMEGAETAFWLLLAYLLGHAIAHWSSFLIETQFLRKVIGPPEAHLFEVKATSKWRLLFPLNFRALPEETRARLEARAESQGLLIGTRAFFLHCHAIVKHLPGTRPRLERFLTLYGFARNTSMALALAAVLLLLGTRSAQARLWTIGAILLSVVLFYRYLTFFRHYTVEVFTTYAELPGTNLASRETSGDDPLS